MEGEVGGGWCGGGSRRGVEGEVGGGWSILTPVAPKVTVKMEARQAVPASSMALQ